MLGWLQGIVSAVWYAFTSEKGNSIFNLIGRNWILIAGILCAIGLIADLCVYILRWKPFRSWKRYLNKDMDTDGVRAHDEFRPEQTVPGPETYPEPQGRTAPELNALPMRDNGQLPDLSQWEVNPEKKDNSEEQPAEIPSMITNAGYVVPADSPYRRPADRNTEGPIYVRETVKGNAEVNTDREGSGVPVTRRRRRISVSELFTDPEEELRQFDAPQHVIDSRKAYRDPVYPRGWKKSEDDEE